MFRLSKFVATLAVLFLFSPSGQAQTIQSDSGGKAGAGITTLSSLEALALRREDIHGRAYTVGSDGPQLRA
jgi:hypothetical protein